MGAPPLVTIVTPSFNSGRFLKQAIQSILEQDYPRIEYLVVDGGSTDETLAILEGQNRRVRFISASDRGPADAVSRGFALTKGGILAWLNSDDYYLPGAVSAAVESLEADPDAGAVYAEAQWVDESGNILGPYPTVRPYDPTMLSRECSICQPTCFFRRSAYEEVGGLDISLKTVFDYDLWIRMARSYRFISIPICAAASRMHPENLSLSQRHLVFQEAIGLLKRHFGYVPMNWIYGSIQYARDRKDHFFSRSIRRSQRFLLVYRWVCTSIRKALLDTAGSFARNSTRKISRCTCGASLTGGAFHLGSDRMATQRPTRVSVIF